MKTRLEEIFRRVFRNPALTISNETTAADVEGWDSVAHLDLILEVENEFSVHFSTVELGRMRNVGDFLQLLEKKTAAKAK